MYDMFLKYEIYHLKTTIEGDSQRHIKQLLVQRLSAYLPKDITSIQDMQMETS